MSLFSNIKNMFGNNEQEEIDNINNTQDKLNDDANNAVESGAEEKELLDLETMSKCQFISFYNEMWRDIPEENHIHIVGDTKMLLKDFLNKAGIDTSDINVDWFYVVTADWSKKELHEERAFDNYCVFVDLLKYDDDNKLSIQGLNRNTFIYIAYTAAEGKGYIQLNIMMDGELGEDALLLNRAAVAHKKPTNDVAESTKILFTFSMETMDEEIAKIKKYKEKGIEKLRHKEEPDLYEIVALGFDTNYRTCFNDGVTLMNEQRWGDAISSLTKAYYELKEIILTERDDEAFDYFTKTCRFLGECYYHKHLYVKASFYIQRFISIKEDKEALDLLKDCFVHLNDIRIMKSEEESYPRETFVLEDVFETLFDIIPGELSDMLWIDNNNHTHGTITKQKDIMHYDIRKAMTHTDSMTLHMSYRYHTTIVDDEYVDKQNVSDKKQTTHACIDKSIRMTDNIVVVNLSKKEHIITMNIMIPRFRFLDNNNHDYPKCVTLQYTDIEYISRDKFEEFRNITIKKNDNKEQLTYEEAHSLATQKEAAYYFANACISFVQRMFGNALFYLSKVCNSVLVKRDSSELNDADRSMVYESFYMLGFIYSELKHYEMSIYYLTILHNFHNINWNIEFINSLTNSKDIFAYDVVATELDNLKNPEKTGLEPKDYNNYKLFLLRRMSHILIDKEAFDDAERLLNDLLQFPECKDYVEKELKYIKEIRD